MVEFKQILCPMDFSDISLRSLAHAVAIANWYEAQLTVLHVVPTFEPTRVRVHIGEPVLVDAMSRDQVLEEMHRSLDTAALPPGARVIAEAGDTPKTIVDQALSNRTELIVMGTHGRRGFQRLLLGSVTERVLRDAPCPVLTVPPQVHGASPDVTFKRIVCPIDFSPSSLQALGFALNLARQSDGRVTLMHVLEWPEEEPRSRVHFNVPEYRLHMAADVKERLSELVADESRTWVDIDPVVVTGRGHRAILKAAESKSADLIVMGAQGKSGMSLALFGSTTQEVIRGATCPVLTVRGARTSAGAPS